MELEAQIKDKERPEEEVMEEEDSCYRKWRGGVSLSEETLSVFETQDPNIEQLHEGSINPSECNPVLLCHL